MTGASTYCETPFLHLSSAVLASVPFVPLVVVLLVPADAPVVVPEFVLEHGVVSLIVSITENFIFYIKYDFMLLLGKPPKIAFQSKSNRK